MSTLNQRAGALLQDLIEIINEDPGLWGILFGMAAGILVTAFFFLVLLNQ